MKNGERGLWTIDELSAKVAEALSAGYGGVPSGRVRDVPDSRTIRYYTTLGLLDRPAAMQGRTALYGLRHLLQLVAIKRLQARGLSLAAVQERVIGLSNAALRKIAAVPAPRPEADSLPARGDSFWRLPAKAHANPGQFAALDAVPCATGSEGAMLPAARSDLQTIPLGEGLVLSMATRRGIDADDIRSIRLAAASLIEVLRLRGLIDTDTATATDAGPKKPGDGR
jgi:MerR HTH family regulatory protein